MFSAVLYRYLQLSQLHCDSTNWIDANISAPDNTHNIMELDGTRLVALKETIECIRRTQSKCFFPGISRYTRKSTDLVVSIIYFLSMELHMASVSQKCKRTVFYSWSRGWLNKLLGLANLTA